MKLSFVAVAFSVLALSTVGCAAQASGEDADSTEADLVAASVSPGTFSLYSEPDTQVNQRCNVFTELTLNGSTAHLEQVAKGIRTIFVIPSERTYHLSLADEECGTKIYKGRTTLQERKHDITITDNRDRICKDFVAAPIIVEETDADGELTTTYAVLPR